MFTYTEAKEIINTLGRFTITSSETNHVHTMVTIDTAQAQAQAHTSTSYFDDEAWKRDAKHDGRGHSLSSYDGQEIEFDNCDLYAYRTN